MAARKKKEEEEELIDAPANESDEDYQDEDEEAEEEEAEDERDLSVAEGKKHRAAKAAGAKGKKISCTVEEDLEPVKEWWWPHYEEDEVRLEAAKSVILSAEKDQRHDAAARLNSEASERLKNMRGSRKWKYLEHCGVLFQPRYVKSNIPLRYGAPPVPTTTAPNAKPVPMEVPPLQAGQEEIVLPFEAEEIATYFARAVGTQNEHKKVFRDNFWKTFTEALPEDLRAKVTDLNLCDFILLRNNELQLRAARLARTREEKEAERQAKLKVEEKHQFALVDTVREKLTVTAAEPAQLFRGRGEHPKQGLLKRRLVPEEVVLNLADDAPIPPLVGAVAGHAWRSVVCEPNVVWLCKWTDTVTGNDKYMQFGPASALKCEPDLLKYERSRSLCLPTKCQKTGRHQELLINKIRKDIRRKVEVRSANEADATRRQVGVVAYLIDNWALRVGNEKKEDEADTFGVCSLQVNHISFPPLEEEHVTADWAPITLDFLGKDSIRFLETKGVKVSVRRALEDFCKGKPPKAKIFDQVSPAMINAYFGEFAPGLSAKVFRTFNASFLLDSELAKMPTREARKLDPSELKEFYEQANRKVAILCNHQRAVSKNHDAMMQKLNDKIALVEKTRDATAKAVHLARLVSAAEEYLPTVEAASKGGAKARAKKAAASKEPTLVGDVELPDSPKELKAFRDKKAAELAAFREKATAEIDKLLLPRELDRMELRLAQLEEKVQLMQADAHSREANKTVSLGTSRINYMDPRITIAFCKRSGMPIETIFPKTLRNKFPWAMHAKQTWRFGPVLEMDAAMRAEKVEVDKARTEAQSKPQ